MKDTLKIQKTHSRQDGIVFYSGRIPGTAVLSNVMHDGSIRAMPLTVAAEDYENGRFGDDPLKDFDVSKRTLIIIDILLIVVSILTKNTWYIFGAIYFAMFASADLIQLFVWIATIKFGKSKSLGRFEAASNMVTNAYNDLKRVPTLEEVRKYSRFSKISPYQKILDANLLILLVLLDILFIGPINVFYYFIFMLGVMVICLLTINGFKLWFLQIFFTNKPTDLELKVAIQGLRELEHFETSI